MLVISSNLCFHGFDLYGQFSIQVICLRNINARPYDTVLDLIV